jgi:hypothetical protein
MTTLRRYARTPTLGFGTKYGTSYAIPAIRDNIASGKIRVQQFVSSQQDRLDIIAGRYYGDGSLWWIIAAASNIGWCPQVPPGTLISVPILSDVVQYVG